MEANNKNNGLICTIVILVIVVLGLGGFIIYDKVLKPQPPIEEKKENDKEQDNNYNEMINKDLLEAYGKILFERVDVFFSNSYYPFYNNVNQNEIDKLPVIFGMVKKVQDVSMYNDHEKCAIDPSVSDFSPCYDLIISIDDFEKKYHEIFGFDAIIDYNTFNYVQGGTEYLIKKDDYRLYAYPSYIGGVDDEIISQSHYEGIEQVDNDLVITVKVITGERGEIEQAYEKEKDNLGSYKVRFKKDSTGNYYWYQSDYIKPSK